MKKCLIIFLIISNCAGIQAQEKIANSDFIIISRMGTSNYFLSPLIISTKPILNLTYDTADFQQYYKYNNYANIIITDSEYQKLLTYLNIRKELLLRDNNAIKKEKLLLIIDCRISGQDYELESFKSLSQTLFMSKSLYCFVKLNIIDEKLADYLQKLYKFYIDTYSVSSIYDENLNCGE